MMRRGACSRGPIDGFGPLDIVMANTGLEVIDVPFTTMKNLTDYLGHPCCDRQINCSIERERGDFAIPRVPNAAHPTSMGFLHSHATTVGDAKQAIG
jgi:hypothetical protein